MAHKPDRPLSPHLQVWKWGPHMLVSILHRMTGVGMAIVAAGLFVWWLLALASGPEAYEAFRDLLTVESGAVNIVGAVLIAGLAWAFFTHFFNGIRHLVLDTGAGYELKINKGFALVVVIGAIVAALALSLWLLWEPIMGLVGGAG
ncbi:MAG: succinate dehydrogenase, cytochrome b556 subunit [Parasphingopyxis sp.]|nr:succinate dehydrogenase, cytochrome b556 subunit [Sphingomonadales bacterium]